MYFSSMFSNFKVDLRGEKNVLFLFEIDFNMDIQFQKFNTYFYNPYPSEYFRYRFLYYALDSIVARKVAKFRN